MDSMTDGPPSGGESPDTSREEADTSPGSPSTDPVGAVLELDEVFAALDHSRRRRLFYTLVNANEEGTLAEFAATIAARERNKPVSDVTECERKLVHVSLYHSRVPKLTELGVIEYHEEEDVVVRAVDPEQVQADLDGADAELHSRREREIHARDTGGEC